MFSVSSCISGDLGSNQLLLGAWALRWIISTYAPVASRFENARNVFWKRHSVPIERRTIKYVACNLYSPLLLFSLYIELIKYRRRNFLTTFNMEFSFLLCVAVRSSSNKILCIWYRKTQKVHGNTEMICHISICTERLLVAHRTIKIQSMSQGESH